MERLSGLDASFLYMESPTLQMNVAFVVICDASNPPEGGFYQQIRQTLDEQTQLQSAYRRRLVEIPFNLHHPLWIDDPDFNIDNHVRHVALPAPGTLNELGIMVADTLKRKLDRSRPLWEAWVIEGLEGNRFALMMKFHHAVVDGVSGTGLIQDLFDPRPVVRKQRKIHRSRGEMIPGDAELVAYAMRSRVGSPKRFMKLLRETADNFQKSFADFTSKRRTGPMQAPKTHFNEKTGVNRRIGLVSLSLSEIKAVKNAAGVTVNDVVLGLCGGVLREYLLKHHDLPEKPLVAMVPVSVRKAQEKDEVNNHVSGMWSTLATHVADPLERLKLIHHDMQDAKEAHSALGADLLQDWAEFSGPMAFSLGQRLYASSGLSERFGPVHNTIISNVPGPREPLYLAGARIEGIYPVGPVMGGVGVNISLASYEDTVNCAIHVDSDLVTDVNELVELFPKAFAELKQRLGLSVESSASATEKKRKPAARKKSGATKKAVKKSPADGEVSQAQSESTEAATESQKTEKKKPAQTQAEPAS